MGSELLALKWNNHQCSFTQTISSSRSAGDYCDVTLVCNGQYYRAHKLVLVNCSEYFTQMLHNTDDKHPLIVLADISHEVLETLLDYLYEGQVNVLRSDMPALFKAATSLKIKGLTMSQDDDNALEFSEGKDNALEFPQVEDNALEFSDGKDNVLEFPQVEDNALEEKWNFENDVDIGDYKREKVDCECDDSLHICNAQSSQENKKFRHTGHFDPNGSSGIFIAMQNRSNSSHIVDYDQPHMRDPSNVVENIESASNMEATDLLPLQARQGKSAPSHPKPQAKIKRKKTGQGRRNESGAWKHFKTISQDEVKCTYCGRMYKSKTATSNLMYHLKMKHNIVFQRLKKNESSSEEQDQLLGIYHIDV